MEMDIDDERRRAALLRACPACGVKNRVPPEHVSETGSCGKCKGPLPPVAEPIEADPALFEAITGSATVPVLVDFWAAWCGPCRMAAPEVERTARNMAGRAVVLKVDTDLHPALAQRFGVTGIPNFVVLKGGRPVFQHAGYAAHTQLEEWLRSV
jgi:thioredoxin 2